MPLHHSSNGKGIKIILRTTFVNIKALIKYYKYIITIHEKEYFEMAIKYKTRWPIGPWVAHLRKS